MMKKVLDWKTKEARARKMTVEALEFSVKDCVEARDAMRGWNPEAEGYYQDEASVYRRELNRRAG